MADTQGPKRHPAGTLQQMREYNLKKNCGYTDWELARINRRWRMWGKLAAQPASLRGDYNRI